MIQLWHYWEIACSISINKIFFHCYKKNLKWEWGNEESFSYYTEFYDWSTPLKDTKRLLTNIGTTRYQEALSVSLVMNGEAIPPLPKFTFVRCFSVQMRADQTRRASESLVCHACQCSKLWAHLGTRENLWSKCLFLKLMLLMSVSLAMMLNLTMTILLAVHEVLWLCRRTCLDCF